MKYSEIFLLKEMLEKAEIPFQFVNRNITPMPWGEKWQIGYPVSPSNKNCICSVIEGCGTYGAEENLLEIMGLLTAEEQAKDSVCGWLTAENVFNRIENHYKGVKKA